MGRTSKLFMFGAIAGILGIIAYAYIADLSPEQTDVTQPVVLNEG